MVEVRVRRSRERRDDILPYDPNYDPAGDPLCTKVCTVDEIAAELGIAVADADQLLGRAIPMHTLPVAGGGVRRVALRARVLAYRDRKVA